MARSNFNKPIVTLNMPLIVQGKLELMFKMHSKLNEYELFNRVDMLILARVFIVVTKTQTPRLTSW